jgi:serine/threonine protein kinase
MDRYKVLRRIGTGTYGSAYLVCLKHDASELHVLKKVQLAEATSDKERQQAETEVRLLAQLDHPFVLG